VLAFFTSVSTLSITDHLCQFERAKAALRDKLDVSIERKPSVPTLVS
jgi:hypothetical protein